MAKPDSYDAQSEYMRSIKESQGPRNVPAAVMSRLRAASIQQLSSPQDSMNLSGLSGSLLQWDSFTKLEKIEKIAELNMGEVRALLSNENDNELLGIMLARKKELEGIR